jgi:hypothetical protein
MVTHNSRIERSRWQCMTKNELVARMNNLGPDRLVKVLLFQRGGDDSGLAEGVWVLIAEGNQDAGIGVLMSNIICFEGDVPVRGDFIEYRTVNPERHPYIVNWVAWNHDRSIEPREQKSSGKGWRCLTRKQILRRMDRLRAFRVIVVTVFERPGDAESKRESAWLLTADGDAKEGIGLLLSEITDIAGEHPSRGDLVEYRSINPHSIPYVVNWLDGSGN